MATMTHPQTELKSSNHKSIPTTNLHELMTESPNDASQGFDTKSALEIARIINGERLDRVDFLPPGDGGIALARARKKPGQGAPDFRLGIPEMKGGVDFLAAWSELASNRINGRQLRQRWRDVFRRALRDVLSGVVVELRDFAQGVFQLARQPRRQAAVHQDR